ncbi:hypothetical protein I3760_13G163400 [Carya illinoinensis]|nr:hypothetical protein I3760_13G163400 [Carya illinoinensis]
MAEVAGLLLSPFLQVFFEKVAYGEFVDFFRSRKLDGGLLKKLEIVLLFANAVLEDAEEMQFTKPTVKKWLHELKDAVYDAEDILDEIHTEVLRCKLDEFQTFATKVRKTFSTSLNPFVREIEPKINDVVETLDHLVKRKDAIGLKEGVGVKSSGRSSTTSLVKESDIFGRTDDKEAIINLLLSDNVSGDELYVIAIVGMGGLGKTTLVQLVYNDDKMEKHFDLKAWVCVSDDFDVLKMTKTMLEKFGLSADSTDGKSLDWLQVTLQQKLTGKKFLLVLDDVWNENYSEWEAFSNPFRFGVEGSRVIVTTRGKRVALIMHSTTTYDLKILQEEYCWSLFSKHAFCSGNSDSHPELEVIGRQIVKRCEGLPLAVKTIGALLWSEVDVSEWNKIMRSEIWDLQNDHVIPALRLSYKYLPLHLKRCFAYCSIFPKDYYFKKEDVILLWMAEGLLPQVKDKTMEQIGDDYFVDLVSRSLFEQSSIEYEKMRFGMHDLINDLARFVSGQFTSRLEGENFLDIVNKTRHVSLFKKSGGNSEKLRVLYQAKRLRTFLSIYQNNPMPVKELVHYLLPTLSCLRVFRPFDCENLIELPDSVGKIKSLRYLDLSGTSIKTIPDSICKLCNLQTLKLQYCDNLTEMPVQLGRLRCLQTLTKFIVGKQTPISDLQNVVSPIDALVASMNDKKYLEELKLEWNDENNISESQRAVLDNLNPMKLEKLLKLEKWFDFGAENEGGAFTHLEEFEIVNCPKLTGELPIHPSSLSRLVIAECPLLVTSLPSAATLVNGAKRFCDSLLSFPLNLFPNLKSIELNGCRNLESINVPQQLELDLVALSSIEINNCPNFVSFPNGGLRAPRLEGFTILNCESLTSLPDKMHILCPSLYWLHLGKCPEIESFPEGGLPSKLGDILIRDCDKLNLPSIRSLIIKGNCKDVESFPEAGLVPTSLLRLYISKFPNMRSLDYKALRHLTSIETLMIECCPKLKFMQEEGLLASISTLGISGLKHKALPIAPSPSN